MSGIHNTMLNRVVEIVGIYDKFEPDEYIAIKFKDFGNGKTYTEEESTYIVSTNDNWFNGGKTISKALWGYCCDKHDRGVRLDWYIGTNWKIDYCYKITKDEARTLMGVDY